MAGRIENLTPEQIARFPEFVSRWKEIGLSTQPMNRPETARGIARCYEIAGRKTPRIVFTTSPLVSGLTRAIIFEMGKKSSVGNSVGNSVWASVWYSVWYSVWASVGGQHEAVWLSFYEYFREVCGLIKQTEKLEGLFIVAKSAGWFLPHEHICWVSERHNILHLDAGGRLHCADGLACGYPEGWGIYAWHGTRCSKQVIESPETLTVENVDKEENAEVKRVMIERFGGAKDARDGFALYLQRAGAKTIAKRGEYELVSHNAPHLTSGMMVAVKMICPSTGALYILRVPPEMTTVESAMNWVKGDRDYFGRIELQT